MDPINRPTRVINNQRQSMTKSESSGYHVPVKRSRSVVTFPSAVLREKAIIWGIPVESFEFAQRMDNEDPLSQFRKLFCFPKKRDLPYVDPDRIEENAEAIYLCGQSLGLKPKSADKYCREVLDNWGRKGVHSHFDGSLPAALCDIPPKLPMSKLVGALPGEVAVMNGLTVNLHLLLATFYRPTAQRYKIMIEEHAFSSDMYAVKSHLTLHGYPVEESLLLFKPRMGEHLLREEDIISIIKESGNSVAVLLLPGINYYTGQFMNIKKITQAAHEKGIIVGVDAAHAAGNVPLHFHDWNVDFAVWCTYKYLNSGPGCIGAIFVHQRLTEKGGTSQFPMLKGWWGNNMKTKFLMKDEFDASAGSDMFRISNPPPLLAASLMSSLDIFSQTSMDDIQKKQFLLTGYLEYMLKHYFQMDSYVNYDDGENDVEEIRGLPTVKIITPSDPNQRGSQLSIMFSVPLTAVQEELQKLGVVCDIRMPNVMRVSPVPLYNSFVDVYTFINTLKKVFDEFETNGEQKLDLNCPSTDTDNSPNRGSSISSASSDSETESNEANSN
ncbi:kynureninase [Tetranychus urticae]|uniref:Kynureninase n=1 Tax=Tetranychus urticae TaxID=32264 RepID=T1KN94_TETUR|nr:kynureninase [Tetranychus urticae]